MTELPSATFPVVFFDGDRDTDVGSVSVTSSLDFTKFKSFIAQRIGGGVSPHQISISLVRRRKARSSPEMRRKVPIDESSDFAAIARERDCFVLAVLRRSRRGRGRRGRGSGYGNGEEKKGSEIAAAPAMTILKRNQDGGGGNIPLGLGFWGYEAAQLRNLQLMREKYLAAYYPYTTAAMSGGGYVSPSAAIAACEECAEARRSGISKGFHRCVNDRITVGFRSPVGPIERPKKGPES